MFDADLVATVDDGVADGMSLGEAERGLASVLDPRITRPVLNYRVNKTRWCVLRWPSSSMAQAAGMSTEAFENLYFDVCTMDYRKMGRAMQPLERLMR